MIHIYPNNDLIEHNTDSHICQCNPKIDFENGLVIHCAMDRREVFEERAKTLGNQNGDTNGT